MYIFFRKKNIFIVHGTILCRARFLTQGLFICQADFYQPQKPYICQEDNCHPKWQKVGCLDGQGGRQGRGEVGRALCLWHNWAERFILQSNAQWRQALRVWLVQIFFQNGSKSQNTQTNSQWQKALCKWLTIISIMMSYFLWNLNPRTQFSTNLKHHFQPTWSTISY